MSELIFRLGVLLKGMGFSPYIMLSEFIGALAPEGNLGVAHV